MRVREGGDNERHTVLRLLVERFHNKLKPYDVGGA